MEGNAGPSLFATTVEGLQKFIEDQRRREDELRREIFLLQEKTRKAKRAIDVLTDRKINEAKPKARKRSSRDAWVPSQLKIDAVLGALSEAPQTVPMIAKLAGVSGETARRSLQHLRTQERVRMAGIVKAGKSNQKAQSYALMPSEGSNGTH